MLMSLFCAVAFACTGKKASGGQRCVTDDSVMINTSSYDIKKIHVGESIANVPLSSQIVTIDGKEKYLMLDEAYIYKFDWNSGELEDSIPTAECGVLNNYSGFTYFSSDKIAVFNSAKRTLFVIDDKGHVVSQKEIPSGKENYNNYVSTIKGLNDCRIAMSKSGIVLSGSVLGCLKDVKGQFGEMPVSDAVDATGCIPVVKYPKEYYENNWGINYMNSAYTACDNKGNILYSFPVLNKVLRYSSDFKTCDTLVMQSRYDCGIAPCKLSMDKLVADMDLEIRYYISQFSYGSIFYDSYRNLYIRVAEHRLDGWKANDTFVKPVSFIVSDTDGKVISETPIIKDDRNYIFSNMHICKDGIVIAMDNKDENNIYFACYKFK